MCLTAKTNAEHLEKGKQEVSRGLGPSFRKPSQQLTNHSEKWPKTQFLSYNSRNDPKQLIFLQIPQFWGLLMDFQASFEHLALLLPLFSFKLRSNFVPVRSTFVQTSFKLRSRSFQSLFLLEFFSVPVPEDPALIVNGLGPDLPNFGGNLWQGPFFPSSVCKMSLCLQIKHNNSKILFGVTYAPKRRHDAACDSASQETEIQTLTMRQFFFWVPECKTLPKRLTFPPTKYPWHVQP